MKIKNLRNYYGLILLVILLLIGVYFLDIKEFFTSCTQLKDCASCVKAKINRTGSKCYWGGKKNGCGSFKDVGYSNKCS